MVIIYAKRFGINKNIKNYINNDGSSYVRLHLGGEIGTSNYVDFGDIQLVDDAWHHLAVVREGTGTDEFVWYIDGTATFTGTLASNLSISSASITSGSTGRNSIR